MENSTDFDMESIYFDDDVLCHEIIMEYVMQEKEEKLRSREYGCSLPEVMTEDGFRLLMETADEE